MAAAHPSYAWASCLIDPSTRAALREVERAPRLRTTKAGRISRRATHVWNAIALALRPALCYTTVDSTGAGDMLAKVLSCAVIGLEGAIPQLEAEASRGLPRFTVVAPTIRSPRNPGSASERP